MGDRRLLNINLATTKSHVHNLLRKPNARRWRQVADHLGASANCIPSKTLTWVASSDAGAPALVLINDKSANALNEVIRGF
jgi:hypothetical protein